MFDHVGIRVGDLSGRSKFYDAMRDDGTPCFRSDDNNIEVVCTWEKS